MADFNWSWVLTFWIIWDICPSLIFGFLNSGYDSKSIHDLLLLMPSTFPILLVFPSFLSRLHLKIRSSRMDESMPWYINSWSRAETFIDCDVQSCPCSFYVILSVSLSAVFCRFYLMRRIFMLYSSSFIKMLSQGCLRHSEADGLSLGFFISIFLRRSFASVEIYSNISRS